MSFMDSWNAYRQGQAKPLSQKYQNSQNSESGAKNGNFGDIGNIGLKSSAQHPSPPKSGDCRQRLSDPGQAGAVSWAALTTWKNEYPHMRPCPKIKDETGAWMWIDRSVCQGCPWIVADENRTLQ